MLEHPKTFISYAISLINVVLKNGTEIHNDICNIVLNNEKDL
jgi:hypothetical protein